MQLYVTLPCKPVVKQYMINRYGPQIIIPDGEWIKCLFENLLQKASAEQDTKVTLQYYTTEVKIPITYKVFELHGDQLTKTAIRAINNRIEELIHQRLYQHLEFYVHVCNYKLHHAIIMFQDMYALPEDIYPHDTIKKYYQRKIQPYLTTQKFTSVNVPIKTKRPYIRNKN